MPWCTLQLRVFCLSSLKHLLSFVHWFSLHLLYGYLLLRIQVIIVIHTYALNTYAFMDTCFFGYKCLRSSIHMLHMLYGHLQVLMILHTHDFSTRALWTLASWYRCLRSSIHMLLVYMLYGHLLFGTSAYCRPYTCFLVQVLKDVHTHAFWYKCLRTFIHMLFGTSA